MSDKDPSKLRPNRPKLALHVPEPPFRPGDTPDFSSLKIPAAGAAPRPDVAAPATETHPLTTHLVRVLGDDHKAVGPWDPKLDADTLRKMLRDMVTVRIFDDRIEVESPGVFPGNITPANIAKAGSKSRNPLIASNLREVPVEKLVSACRSAKLR